ncbi:hypothetical protein ABZ215_24740 [Amycolatopsis sp. NPDC006131]|uniref:hypothetical protein n=1 Tax=Amycolatopsis sp. NPDC006131 TaxID=3156731 RepID=UPI0033A12A82
MYDSTRANNIPADAGMVAGYVDQYTIPKWSAEEWARFPRAVKVRIAKKASTNDGHVLDVEPGLAIPAEAPGWAQMRRRAGVAPTIYCNKATWGEVQEAFNDFRVPQPHYWIAHYNGERELPTLNGITAVAKQYADDKRLGKPYDLSCVADYWPGVDPIPPAAAAAMNQEDEIMFTHTLPRGAGYHRDTLTLESDGVSTLVQDVYVSLASGFDGLRNVKVYFPGGGDPAAGSDDRFVDELPKDTREWWKLPKGCFAFSIEYECVSDGSCPSLSVVYTRK